MSAEYTYDPGLVFNDLTSLPAISQLGDFYASADSATPLAIYDLMGNPITRLQTNSFGFVGRFRADVPYGVVGFGSLKQPVISFEAQSAGLDAAAAKAAAEAAADSAADALALIQAGGGGGGNYTAEKGQPNGLATLGADGLLSVSQRAGGSGGGGGNIISVNGESGVVTVTLQKLGAAQVAIDGQYGSLLGKPVIPTLASQVGAIATSARGASNGVASLDSSAKVPIVELPVGTSAGTVMAGDYVPNIPLSKVPSGYTHTIVAASASTPRPTTRPDVFVRWICVSQPTNLLNGVDVWERVSSIS